MTSRLVSTFFGAMVTLGLTALVWWWVWPEAPKWIRGTLFSEYSYLSSLALIIIGLSVLDFLIGGFFKGPDH